MIFPKNKEGVRAIRATKKPCNGKIYSRTRTFGARVHKSNIRVERWHNKYETLNYMEKTRIFFKQFAYIKSNCTALQSLTYKEEERTFWTPCDWIELIYFFAVNGLLGAASYGVAMSKHSPYIRNISVAILRLQETSVLDSLHRKWWEYKSHCPKDSSKRGRASGLEWSALKH